VIDVRSFNRRIDRPQRRGDRRVGGGGGGDGRGVELGARQIGGVGGGGVGRRVVEQWGIHTPEQWLVWQAGLSRAHARQVVAVTRRVPELPHLYQAVHDGALSLDQAEVVARHCPVGFDADVVGVAVNATVPQLHRMLGRYQFTEPVPDTPADPPPRDPEPERRVSFGSTDDGSWHASLDLPADEGALYEQALVAKRDELFRRDHPGVDADSPEGRAARRDLSWADAAVALAADSLATGDKGQVGGSDLFRVLVHLEADPTNPTGPGVAGLHLGAPLPPALRRMLLCDCEVVPVWETLGNPVAVGRAQRIVPRRVRRLIEHRDKGCRVPGCGQKRCCTSTTSCTGKTSDSPTPTT